MTNTTMTKTANPFYAARVHKATTQYAILPRAPQNASPVPHLTSLYHFHERGSWGDAAYPGNCSGYLIRDLLRFFGPETVFDPMTGSGTCRDVCNDLGLPCESTDLKSGADACSKDGFRASGQFDFIWAHPPYWRMKVYSDQPGDLSQAPSLDAFLTRYRQFIANCAAVLKPGGHFAVLMGDYSDREAGFVPLVHHTKQLAFESGLRQASTDIIRFSHGATSSRKTYRSAFIPGLHDVCMVFTSL